MKVETVEVRGATRYRAGSFEFRFLTTATLYAIAIEDGDRDAAYIASKFGEDYRLRDEEIAAEQEALEPREGDPPDLDEQLRRVGISEDEIVGDVEEFVSRLPKLS